MARRLSALRRQLTPVSCDSGLTIEKIPSCTGGAVVRGVSLEGLGDEDFLRIKAAFLEHGFLVSPGQTGLSKQGYAAFGQRWGLLEFENSPISNAKADGTVLEGGAGVAGRIDEGGTPTRPTSRRARRSRCSTPR